LVLLAIQIIPLVSDIIFLFSSLIFYFIFRSNMPRNSNPSSSSPSNGGRSDDPAWAHGKPVADSKNSSICIYCDKRLNGGGITRLKYHLAGVKGQAQVCRNVPENVRFQMKRLIANLTTHQTPRKRRKSKVDNNSDNNNTDNNAIVEDSGNLIISSSRSKPSGSRRSVGLLTALTTPRSDSAKNRSHVDPVHEAQLAIAKWWYDAKVPFSAANSSYYQVMVDAIARVGPGFKAPNFNDLRGPLLKEAAFDIKEHIANIKREWGTYGCSVMVDGWTTQRPEPIINFFAYSPGGTVFLKSVDVSGLNKSREALFEIFDQVVREVGPENVVQFITGMDTAHKEAGTALQQRYATFFWSPCAAHCIDLILETFSNQSFFPFIDETLKKARKVTKFIYNNASILSMLRKEFTNGHDLCRTCVTRFATHFLSLHCILKFKKEICQMFSCRKWQESPHASGNTGKEVADIILQDKEFWAQCQHIVEVTEPLVCTLRLVDSDEKPAIGYIYEAIEKAKEAIKLRLKNNSSVFGPYMRVIETIWEKELCSPLHGAGCFLNPSLYFKNGFGKQSDVNRGLLNTITRLVQSDEIQEKIGIQLEAYKRSTGDFGLPLAVRLRDKLSPGRVLKINSFHFKLFKFIESSFWPYYSQCVLYLQ
jgi:Protein of unknown function (DUF 659)/BED zinc finger